MNTEALVKQMTGEVIVPDDAAYEALRGVVYRVGSPALIVRPRTTGDIATAIQFATDNGLTLSVRSGGHGLAGLATNEGGLVVDMTHFDGVDVIDADGGIVRVGAGARWGDVANALAVHGLALSSGDTTSVGVGGLTLGGGIGWLVRQHGLTIDSLLSAELVTANGDVLRASADEQPDLFWALRGGGGNFGIVTAFEFGAQPIASVVGGMIIYDLAERVSVMKRWAEAMRAAPDALNSTLVLFSGFGPQVPPQLMVLVCYAGDDDAEANAAIAPLLALGDVKQQDIRRKPYHEMLEGLPPHPAIRAASGSGFIKALDDETFDVIAAHYGAAGQPIFQLRALGGAFARIPAEATAFAHRDAEVVYWAVSMLPGEASSEAVEQRRQTVDAALRPFAVGAYGNFLSGAGEDSVAAVYPPATYARLAEVKRRYDPNNLFDQNQNVQPSVDVTA